MTQNSPPVLCSNCGTEDHDPDHRVPCPNCGDIRRIFSRQIVEATIPVTDHISVSPTFHSIREFYQDNPKLIRLHVGYWLGGTIVGYLVSLLDIPIGVFVGAIIGSMSFVKPPYTKNHLYP